MHLGSSNSVCDPLIVRTLEFVQPRTLVDFGAGAGKNGRLARAAVPSCHCTAVEGHPPTAAHLRAEGVYDSVYGGLLQNWLVDAVRDGEYADVAIFGDVLEHLRPGEGHRVLRQALRVFRHVLVVVPLHDVFQDAIEGNELEVHRAYITVGWFDRYRPEWQHIAREGRYTVIAVHLTPQVPLSMGRRLSRGGFHTALVGLQLLGLARPTVEVLKRVTRPFRHAKRN